MYKDFSDMSVWKVSMEVAESIFHLTNELPKKEDYGLTSQLRRASVSISANIAEGFGRRTSPDKRKFYDYSRGSAFETKSLLIYGERVGYFPLEEVRSLTTKLSQIIYDLNKINMRLSGNK